MRDATLPSHPAFHLHFTCRSRTVKVQFQCLYVQEREEDMTGMPYASDDDDVEWKKSNIREREKYLRSINILEAEDSLQVI